MEKGIARVKWAAHGKAVSSFVSGVKNKQDVYSDCVLSCRGGKQFPAHRVVLAMASPFFSAILRSSSGVSTNPASTCIIVLDDVEEDHLESLLQYMYYGYSIVRCDRLASLSRTAKALGIKEFPTLEIVPPQNEVNNASADITTNIARNDVPTNRGKKSVWHDNDSSTNDFFQHIQKKIKLPSEVAHANKSSIPQGSKLLTQETNSLNIIPQRVYFPRDFKQQANITKHTEYDPSAKLLNAIDPSSARCNSPILLDVIKSEETDEDVEVCKISDEEDERTNSPEHNRTTAHSPRRPIPSLMILPKEQRSASSEKQKFTPIKSGQLTNPSDHPKLRIMLTEPVTAGKCPKSGSKSVSPRPSPHITQPVLEKRPNSLPGYDTNLNLFDKSAKHSTTVPHDHLIYDVQANLHPVKTLNTLQGSKLDRQSIELPLNSLMFRRQEMLKKRQTIPLDLRHRSNEEHIPINIISPRPPNSRIPNTWPTDEIRNYRKGMHATGPPSLLNMVTDQESAGLSNSTVHLVGSTSSSGSFPTKFPFGHISLPHKHENVKRYILKNPNEEGVKVSYKYKNAMDEDVQYKIRDHPSTGNETPKLSPNAIESSTSTFESSSEIPLVINEDRSSDESNSAIEIVTPSIVSENHKNSTDNDPLLTKISTTKRRRVRGPKSWEYLLRLLRDQTTNPSLIRWENEKEGIFRLVKPDVIAVRWGKRTGKHFTEMLSYENFARGLRYHYVTGALSAVSERCFVYKFGPKAQNAIDGKDEFMEAISTKYNKFPT